LTRAHRANAVDAGAGAAAAFRIGGAAVAPDAGACPVLAGLPTYAAGIAARSRVTWTDAGAALTGLGGRASDQSANADPILAGIVGRAGVVVIAARAIRLGWVGALASGGVAGASVMALVQRRAYDRVTADAGTILTGVGLGTEIIVIAGRAVGFDRVGTLAGGWVADTRNVALVQRGASRDACTGAGYGARWTGALVRGIGTEVRTTVRVRAAVRVKVSALAGFGSGYSQERDDASRDGSYEGLGKLAPIGRRSEQFSEVIKPVTVHIPSLRAHRGLNALVSEARVHSFGTPPPSLRASTVTPSALRSGRPVSIQMEVCLTQGTRMCRRRNVWTFTWWR